MYKIGDKFVIEICWTTHSVDAKGKPITLYAINGFNTLVFDKNGLDRLEKLDSDYVNENYKLLQDAAYIDGLNDAWELAREIINEKLSFKDARDCFDIDINGMTGFDVIKKIFSMQHDEVASKFKAYKSKQSDIKVGDVVYLEDDDPDEKGVVTIIDKVYDEVSILWFDGSCGDLPRKEVKGTGECVDIWQVLEQLSGGKE